MTSLTSEEWEKLSSKPFALDQTCASIEFSHKEIELFYLPLAETILKKRGDNSRVIAGVAGPPGSGKTIFANLLVSVINLLEGRESSVYVGLDGWHFPNIYLETHTLLINGEIIPLKEIKGAPESFDSGAALICLEQIRHGELVHFPLYSRELHDPVPGKGAIEPYHRIIIFEGNYLLLDESPWTRFNPYFDISIFLDAETSCLLEGLRLRHLKGGKNSDLIGKHLQRVDLPNILRVKSNSKKADVIIHKVDNRRISSIEGLG